MSEEKKREPLLNKGTIAADSIAYAEEENSCYSNDMYGYLAGAESVAFFYEAKITDGTLIVVKTCHDEGGDFDDFICSECHEDAVFLGHRNFCPNCGAKIIEE